MKNLKKKVFYIAFVFISAVSFAQKNTVFTATFQKGIIAPHHKSMNYLIKDYIYSIDVNYGKQTNGSKPWHSVHHFPVVGAGGSFADFKNPDVFGKAFSAYSFIDYPFLRKNHFEISGNFAAGLAFLTKPLSPISNDKNYVIGSHFNAYLHVYLFNRIHISNKFQFQTGFGITHFSNGATKRPNLGINLVTVSAAVVFSPQKTDPEIFKKKNTTTFVRSNNFTFFLATGFRYFYPPWDKIYNNSSFNFTLERSINEWFRAGCGIDIFYDKCLINSMPAKDNFTKKDFIFPGIFVSAEIVFGKFSFVYNQGGHPKVPFSGYPKIYERWAVRYKLTKHTGIRIALKEHLGTAQFVEYGIGYSF